MSATILYQGNQYAPAEFSNLDLPDGGFDGLKAGQQFIHFWHNNKQFFDQKTSGSTGNPTIHQISRQMIMASANRTVDALKLQLAAKALVCINMAYIGGKMMLARGLMNDWQLELMPPNADLANILSKQRFDFAAMVPLQLKKLVDHKNGRQLINQIDTLIIGGAAVSADLKHELQQLDCKIYATYGMTETVSHVALQRLNGKDRSEFFTMLPGIQHAVDESGCLKLKADVTNYEWVVTNDQVAFINDREFKVLGRADNVINTGGVKVQIETLENQIRASGLLPQCEFAISYLPDPILGSKIVLVSQNGHELSNQLLAQLKDKLPVYHAPKEIIDINKLPRTASDKLDRLALRDWLLKNC